MHLPISGIFMTNKVEFKKFIVKAFILAFFINLIAVFPAMAEDASGEWDRLSQVADTKGKVKVIVKLKEDASSTTQSSPNPVLDTVRSSAIDRKQDQVLENLTHSGINARGAKRFEYIPYLAMDVDAQTLEVLRNDPNVEAVEEDIPSRATLTGSIPVIGADNVFTNGITGQNWAVAILDTGVDTAHSFFGSRVVSEACYSTNSGSDITSVCPGGVTQSTAVGSGVHCSASDATLAGECDHGTHVAGIAAGADLSSTGVGQGADIISIQVFTKFSDASDCAPASAPCVSSFPSDQILALERVLTLSASMDIASVNMSLGGGRNFSHCDVTQAARKAAIDNLRAAGIATVIASGNDGWSDSMNAPACISTAVSVSSTTKADAVSIFSNTDTTLELFAPGEDITSSIPGGGFTSLDGTSMAAPHVAGAWALMREAADIADVDVNVDAILNTLQLSGVGVTDPANGITFPRIQVDTAVTALQTHLTINSGPSPASDPIASAAAVLMSFSVTDALAHSLNYNWTADCGGSIGDGSFNDNTLANPTWTASSNQTGADVACDLEVTVDDGVEGFSMTRTTSVTVQTVPAALTYTPGDDFILSGPEGGAFSPATKDYTVENTGGGSNSFEVTSDVNWLTVPGGVTNLGVGAQSVVQVAVNANANSLPAGIHNGIITFDGDSNDTTRNVTLTVTGTGPTPLIHETFESGSPDPFWSSTNGTVDGTSKIDGVNSFTLDASGERVIKNGVNSNFINLQFKMRVDSASTATNGQRTRWDLLKQWPNHVVMWLSRSGGQFHLGVGTDLVANVQQTTISADTVHDIELEADTTTGEWKFRVDGAVVSTGNHSLAQVSQMLIGLEGFNASSFLVYMDEIKIFDQDPTPANLDITPTTDLIASGLQGGPFSPNSETYTITNNGGSSNDVEVTSNVAWLDVPASPISVGAGLSEDAIVSINANANSLIPGVHVGTVTFDDLSGDSDTTRDVELTVSSIVAPLVTETFETGSVQPFWSSSSGDFDTNSLVSGVNSFLLNASGDRVVKSGVAYNFVNLQFKLRVDSSSTATSGDRTRWDLIKQWPNHVVLWLSKDGADFKLGVGTSLVTTVQDITILPDTNYDIELEVDGSGNWAFKVDGSDVSSGTHSVSAVNELLIGFEGFNAASFNAYIDDILIFDQDPSPSALSVTPLTGLDSSGNEGGPFTPGNKFYTLENIDIVPHDIEITSNVNWLDVPGAPVNVPSSSQVVQDIVINANANGLAPGVHEGIITFDNTTGTGDTTRTVTLTVNGAGQGLPLVTETFETGSPLPFWNSTNGDVDTNSRVSGNNSFRIDSSGERVVKNGINSNFVNLQFKFLVDSASTATDGQKTRWDLVKQWPNHVVMWLTRSGGQFHLGVGTSLLTSFEDITIQPDTVYDIELEVDTTGGWVFKVDGSEVSSGVHSVTQISQMLIGFEGFNAGSFIGYMDDILIYDQDPISGFIQVDPETQQDSTGPVGGPFGPDAFVFDVRNLATVSNDVDVSVDVNWLDLSTPSLNLAANQESPVTATINANANALGEGTHIGMVTFDQVGGASNQVRTISLEVTNNVPPAVPPLVVDTFETGTADLFWSSFGGTVDTNSKINGAHSLQLNASGHRVIKNGLNTDFLKVKFKFMIDSASTAEDLEKVRWDIAKTFPDFVHLWLSKAGSNFKLGVNTEAATSVQQITILPDIIYDICIDVDTVSGTWKFIVNGTQVSTGSHDLTNIADTLIGYEGFNADKFLAYMDDVTLYDAEPGENELGAFPTRLNYGLGLVGSPLDQIVSIVNMGDPGDPSITVSSTSMAGTDAGDFSDDFDDVSGVTLAPGESHQITVTFQALSLGAKTATLNVFHSGSNSPMAIPLTGTGVDDIPISFGKSSLLGITLDSPTTLQFGPDDRLYVTQQNGLIYAYSIARNGANSYSAILTETISEIQNIPNHDDDGTLNPSVNTRQVTGIYVTGTATNPVIYVTSSDPRIGAGTEKGDLDLDTNSSMLSRLTWNGASWDKLDLVRGLPRSEENHSANGIVLDELNNIMYLTMGGNTNHGGPSNNFAFLPETALSAAILEIDLNAIGESTYDLPTLDDEDRAGVNDLNDPFGGNNGKNQAILDPTGPVQVYSPGWRNPYDLVVTEAGRMYSIDNGGNAGWGEIPVSEGPAGNCTNDISEPGVTDLDQLHLITGPGYYAGHPNPTRGNMANTFNPTNPQSPVSSSNAVECDYLAPVSEDGAITDFPTSTNGMDEYTASNFQGKLTGNLLAAGFDNILYRIELDATGTTLVTNEPLASNVGFIPLDVVAHGDDDLFPGTIWMVDIATNDVIILEPGDFGGATIPICTGADDNTIDEDEDGFDNADEIDNGTNPCSPADVPSDHDGDGTSDLNDPDDDNDGILDNTDHFALDPDNGTTTYMPLRHTWDNDEGSLGGILDLGWTGLMTNHSTNYRDLYDPTKMTAGGAAGAMTVDEVSAGSANFNNQEYGFQVGVNINDTSPVFTVHSRVLAPFAGISPANYQSMGLFFGTGDQDDYIKIVVEAQGGTGGLELAKEESGTFTQITTVAETMPGPDYVDLYLEVNPAANTVQASYEVTTGGVTGSRTNVGGLESIPSTWFTSGQGMAVGVISTSIDATPFPATWDFIEVIPDDTTSEASFEITPGGGIDVSTFGSNSFLINNDSTGTQNIEKVIFDISTGFMGDMVFDPDGTAGDPVGKPFTPNTGEVDTGYTTHALSKPNGGGYQQVEINFNDFEPGELFGFSIDIDPTSIKAVAAPGPNESGSVSGLELTGSKVTVVFDNGTAYTSEPFAEATSEGGGLNIVRPLISEAPTLEILGIGSVPTTVSDASQTARISGEIGASVKLFVAETGLFLAGVPDGGFDIDPNETNSVVTLTQHTAVIGGSGFVDIPITLTNTDPDAGSNTIVAVIEDSDGATSDTAIISPIQFEPAP